MSKYLPLDLTTLVPQEIEFSFETSPTIKITLVPWSLRVRKWAIGKYTQAGLQKILKEQQISEIAEIAFFMLKDKNQFKTSDEFLDLIKSVKDQIILAKALLTTIGIGEPELNKVMASLDEEKDEANPAPNVPAP